MVRRTRQMPLPTTAKPGIDARYNPTLRYDIMYIDPETGDVKELVGMGFKDDDSPLKMLERMGIPPEHAVITVSKKR